MSEAFSINSREFNLGYITLGTLHELSKKDLPEEAKANFRLFSLFDFVDVENLNVMADGTVRIADNTLPLGPDGKVSNLETAGIHMLFGGKYQVAICRNEKGEIVLSSFDTPDIIEMGLTPIKKIEYVDDNLFIVKEYDELKREKVHKSIDTDTGHEGGYINIYNEDNYSNEPNSVTFFEDQVQDESLELEYYDPPENKLLKKMTETIIQYDENGNVKDVKRKVTEPIYNSNWKRIDTNYYYIDETGKHIDIDG